MNNIDLKELQDKYWTIKKLRDVVLDGDNDTHIAQLARSSLNVWDLLLIDKMIMELEDLGIHKVKRELN